MPEPKLVRNLLGELVPAEPDSEKIAELEQKQLFENEVTPEVKLARKLAQQHREEGGKELFE